VFSLPAATFAQSATNSQRGRLFEIRATVESPLAAISNSLSLLRAKSPKSEENA